MSCKYIHLKVVPNVLVSELLLLVLWVYLWDIILNLSMISFTCISFHFSCLYFLHSFDLFRRPDKFLNFIITASICTICILIIHEIRRGGDLKLLPHKCLRWRPPRVCVYTNITLCAAGLVCWHCCSWKLLQVVGSLLRGTFYCVHCVFINTWMNG
jgi:hypothetical protein